MAMLEEFKALQAQVSTDTRKEPFTLVDGPSILIVKTMKLPLLITALFLSMTPVWGQTTYEGGDFSNKEYSMTFHRVPGTKHKYAVAIIERLSPKDKNGFIVPMSLGLDCINGKAEGYVILGNKDIEFGKGVLLYYLKEFCSRNGYRGYKN